MLNYIVIAGRLTADPVLRYTGANVPVTNFTIACERDFKDKETGNKETDFIECAVWRNTAEFVSKYFTKGSMAVVSGRLQIRKWTDKEGNNRSTAEIVADNVYFGESKKSEGTGGAYVPAQDPAAETLGKYGIGDFSAPPMPSEPNAFALLDEDDSQLPF